MSERPVSRARGRASVSADVLFAAAAAAGGGCIIR